MNDRSESYTSTWTNDDDYCRMTNNINNSSCDSVDRYRFHLFVKQQHAHTKSQEFEYY